MKKPKVHIKKVTKPTDNCATKAYVDARIAAVSKDWLKFSNNEQYQQTTGNNRKQ